MAVGLDERKRRVTYFYEPSVRDFNNGAKHFIKPERKRMTDNLVKKIHLYEAMDIVRRYRANEYQLVMFHSKDYVNFLKSVAPNMIVNPENQMKFMKFYIDEDCPMFDGVYDFSQLSTGRSIGVASLLNEGKTDIAINGK